MTAAQIAEIVGTERKAWWPKGIHFSGGGWWHWDHAGVPPELLEDAFIGAAVRKLLQMDFNMMQHDDGAFTVWHREPSISHENKCLLAALVAALNESEAR